MKNYFFFIYVIIFTEFIFGTVTNNGATVTVGENVTVTFAGNFHNTSGTVTNSGTVSIVGNMVNDGSFISNQGSNLRLSGTDQSFPGGIYQILIVENGGTKTLLGDATVNGYTTVDGSILDLNGFTLTTNGIYDLNGGTVNESGGQMVVNEVNHSLSFDGVNDYVNLGNQLDISGDFTIETYIQLSNSTNVQPIFCKSDETWSSNGSVKGYMLEIGGGILKFGYRLNNQANWNSINATTTITNNQWYNVIVTRTNNDIKLFIDGVVVGSGTFSGNITFPASVNTYIGKWWNGGGASNNGYLYEGLIDRVSLWNTALSQSEIQSNMSTPPTGSESGLVGYWNFNEGSGSTLTDLSGNGNDGTINGATWSDDVPPPPMVSSVQITGSSGFRILSSPVSGNIYSDLLDELWTQGMTGSDDPNHGGANVWTWSSGSWQALTDLDNDTYTAGDGILVYVFADANFDGVADDLPVTLSIDNVDYSGEESAATTESSFNLLGNPYGWSLDISQLLADNSDFYSTVYVWDNAISAYRNYNGQAGDIADGLLAPFQGFWVEANTNGNSFTFTDASISAGQGTNYRSTAVDSTGSALITFTSAEHTSSVYLSFTLDGQVNDDPADAYRLMPLSSESHLTSMFYVSNDAVSIKNLPYDFNADIGLDLDVMMLAPSDEGFETVSEDITMTWDFAEMPEGISMILMDNATSELINMNETDHYDLTVEPKGGFESDFNQVLSYPAVGQNRFSIYMSGATAGADQNFIPEEFALHPAYPNPFNPVTTIHYDVNQTGRVQLKVYDMMGREVAELVNGVVLAGKHRLHWNTPGNMASGIYLVQINNGQKIFNQRITLLK